MGIWNRAANSHLWWQASLEVHQEESRCGCVHKTPTLRRILSGSLVRSYQSASGSRSDNGSARKAKSVGALSALRLPRGMRPHLHLRLGFEVRCQIPSPLDVPAEPRKKFPYTERWYGIPQGCLPSAHRQCPLRAWPGARVWASRDGPGIADAREHFPSCTVLSWSA